MDAHADVPEISGYEIVRRIGRGGMGEVFHAVRTGPSGFRKDVALKRLVSERHADPETLERFLREARIAARLEHEHIVRTYDLVPSERGYVLVMEFLEGASLSELLHAPEWTASKPPWPIVLEIALGVVEGLEYAHALADEHGRPLGLVHRDLTPRNVFLCSSGAVKILDFGIAKLLEGTGGGLTKDGTVAGTLEMLPPERARGEPGTARSDLWQVGALLYRALSGRYPHGAGLPADVLARAIHGAPTPLDEERPDLPARVRAIVARAMAKEPEERFASASEMAIELRAALEGAHSSATLAEIVRAYREREAAAEPAHQGVAASHVATRPERPRAIESTELAPVVPSAPGTPPASAPRAPRSRRALYGAVVAAAIALSFAAGTRVAPKRDDAPSPSGTPSVAPATSPPRWTRLTFRRGGILAARFAPDGAAFVFTAAWGEDPTASFLGTPGSPDTRALGDGVVTAVSPSGTVLLLRRPAWVYGFARRGVLARATLAGEAPRDVLDGVHDAFFGPDGETLGVVRWERDRAQLEYPQGKVLHATDAGWIGEAAVRGSAVAFVRHPVRFDDGGVVAIVREDGRVDDLTPPWMSIQGLAFAANGKEILFSAASEGLSRKLLAVGIEDKRVRTIAELPFGLTLRDVHASGAMLVTRDLTEMRVAARARGADRERDLSWFDATAVLGMSRDGTKLLLQEGGGDAVKREVVGFVRPMDGGPAVRLGAGVPLGLDAEARHALVMSHAHDALSLVPLGAGAAREILRRPNIQSASILPSGELLVQIAAEGKGSSLAIVDAGGAERDLGVQDLALTPWSAVSASGGEAIAKDLRTDALVVVPLARRGPALPIAASIAGDTFVGWATGRAIYVLSSEASEPRVDRIDLDTGKRTRTRELVPPDPSGRVMVSSYVSTADGAAYAYTHTRSLSVLFRLDGAGL